MTYVLWPMPGRPVPFTGMTAMLRTRLVLLESATLPLASSPMTLLSCPPMSMTVRASGTRCRAPRAPRSVVLRPDEARAAGLGVPVARLERPARRDLVLDPHLVAVLAALGT